MANPAYAYPMADGYLVKFPMGHSVFVKDTSIIGGDVIVVQKTVDAAETNTAAETTTDDSVSETSSKKGK